jgi:hypothetical protein
MVVHNETNILVEYGSWVNVNDIIENSVLTLKGILEEQKVLVLLEKHSNHS